MERARHVHFSHKKNSSNQREISVSEFSGGTGGVLTNLLPDIQISKKCWNLMFDI
jgi:hypothetical protein